MERRPLPRLATLFTTDGYRAPLAVPSRSSAESLDEWELALDDEREYGLQSASGLVQITPPAY